MVEGVLRFSIMQNMQRLCMNIKSTSANKKSHLIRLKIRNMAGTYTKLNIQIVFAVKHREPLLAKSWRKEVFAHMADTIKSKGSHPIIINGVEDHVHIFIGLNPKNSISDLVSDLKRNSGIFIRDKFLQKKKFLWQEGYAAFSYSQNAREKVVNYIDNQEAHHCKKDFTLELKQFLEINGISYSDQYLP